MSTFFERIEKEFPYMIEDHMIGISDCPPGWEKIVYDLFSCIDRYVSNTKIAQMKPGILPKINRVRYYCLNNVMHRLCACFDPYKPYRSKDNTTWWTITPQVQEKVKKTRRYKIQESIKAFFHKINAFPKMYDNVSPPQVTVSQIKQKFGTLRFYYNGGDDTVDGMVSYAEYLSSITCEETGTPGSTCARAGWCRTLSDEKAKEFGYEHIKSNCK